MRVLVTANLQKYLEIIMKEIPTTDTLHLWATSYHKDINSKVDLEKASLPGKTE
jgi:hypothetical protein